MWWSTIDRGILRTDLSYSRVVTWRLVWGVSEIGWKGMRIAKYAVSIPFFVGSLLK